MIIENYIKLKLQYCFHTHEQADSKKNWNEAKVHELLTTNNAKIEMNSMAIWYNCKATTITKLQPFVYFSVFRGISGSMQKVRETKKKNANFSKPKAYTNLLAMCGGL